VSGHLHAAAALPPRKEPSIDWIGGWVGPRAGLDAVAKRKKFHDFPCRFLNPGPPSRVLVTILSELPRLHGQETFLFYFHCDRSKLWPVSFRVLLKNDNLNTVGLTFDRCQANVVSRLC
jgi:hypothetical protein